MADNIIREITPSLIFQAIFIIAMGLLTFRIIRFVIPIIAEKVSGKRRLTVLYMIPVSRLIVLLIVLTSLLNLFIDASQQDLITIIGAVGLAIGFAFKDYVSNLIAGFVILYEAPFRPGDWIEVNGTYGEVMSIGLRVLEIRTSDDTIVKIPQSIFWNTPIFNSSSGQKELMCVISFYLKPDADAHLVLSLLRDSTRSSSYYQHRKGINITINEKLGYTLYRIKAYPIDARQQFKFISDVTIRVKDLLKHNSISYVDHPFLPKS
ncbi:MAG: mechanosensitive ion channel [Candidatus Heimdallarchaeota archaeon]|nr:mechanosensitive ion channel [Candidatus Heimdallarchaeota archaeon]